MLSNAGLLQGRISKQQQRLISSEVVMGGTWRRLVCVSAIVLSVQVSAIQWSSCGNKNDSIQLKQLTILPDVLQMPGSITVNGIVKVKKSIVNPVEVSLEVKKKMFWGGYVRIPCEDGYGSCTYGDVCTLSPYNTTCPAIFDKYNLPCKCPIKQDTYTVQGFPVHVERGHIPKFLVSGKYKIHVTISSRGQQMGCYDAQLSLK